MTIPAIKLTSLASAAGCAAKFGPGDLSEFVFPLTQLFNPTNYPDLIVGLSEPDDAGVMKLNDEQAIIMTTDFFPPVVDDPYWYGAIAAANAMSDVYAMGGAVMMALNLVAFPADQDARILAEILRGGAETVQKSGGILIGGHTIMDQEPKYGLAVTGIVHPDRITQKGGAEAGDVLILTKPLGTGLITTALKRGLADDSHVQTAMESMATLNRKSAELAQQYHVKGMSDVTGYSLLGHGYEMARWSGHDFHFNFEALHWLPGAEQYAQQEIFPGGTGRNKAYYRQFVNFAPTLAENTIRQGMLFDPQTSGGLLMAVKPELADALLADLVADGIDARQIGEVQEGTGIVWVHE